MGLVIIGAIPVFLGAGRPETVTGFPGNVARCIGADLPEHLVGARKVMARVRVSIGSTLPVLPSAAGVFVAVLRGADSRMPLCRSIALVLLMSGLHSRDLTPTPSLAPFVPVAEWRGWATFLGATPIFRPPTIAAWIPSGSVASTVFPGAPHAAIELMRLACTVVLPRRDPQPLGDPTHEDGRTPRV